MATINSIWKDTYYTVPASASPFSYTINDITADYSNPKTIFSGRAFVAPAEANIQIKVNDICKDYLSIELPTMVPGSVNTDNPEAVKRFSIADSGGTVVAVYYFSLDWSYEVAERATTGAFYLSSPINFHGGTNMYYLCTKILGGTCRTNCASSTVSTLYADNKKFVDGYCGDYALYYLNRYGGWDSFLIEGNVKRKDEYNRLSITTPFNNNTMDWGKRNYSNQITPSWEITTGYLTDSESAILAKHLLPSNQVYLHNLKTGEITPVILTDGTGDFKTFRTNGRRFITYTINAQASQTQQNNG